MSLNPFEILTKPRIELSILDELVLAGWILAIGGMVYLALIAWILLRSKRKP